jgi:hypothetical protein
VPRTLGADGLLLLQELAALAVRQLVMHPASTRCRRPSASCSGTGASSRTGTP